LRGCLVQVMQILLVEDDPVILAGLQTTLTNENFVVNTVSSGEDAIFQAKISPPDIVVLDIGLPDINGLDVLQAIRLNSPDLPVLLLTARDDISDKVKGLNAGADDYITKPFEIEELIARLRVIERRLGTATNSCITVGNVSLDTDTYVVKIDGEPLDVPRREYMLLKALMEREGSVLSKDQLEKKLYAWGEETSSNAIEVHIHNLRKKLYKDFITTIRGIGYTIKKS